MGVQKRYDAYLDQIFTFWCTLVLGMCRFARFGPKLAFWAHFSRSKLRLFYFHVEIRQGTHGILSADIILIDSTRQSDPPIDSGPAVGKSWVKIDPLPPPQGACGPGDPPSRNYNWAPRESWGRATRFQFFMSKVCWQPANRYG